MLQELQRQFEVITERLKQLRRLEQVTANRITGAITSSMLLPTFIVGLYGQNFEDMPESQWLYRYLFSWKTIVIVTTLQIWLFKKRKWL
jgi:magnesium transporter